MRLHLTRESLLGLVFLASGAGAVIVGDRITQEAHDLSAILFGSAVVVQPADLVLVAAATVVLLFGHLLCWRALIFVGYDPIGARVQELPVRRLNTFLFLSIGIAVALSTRALGALPVFAFSVLPAMAALAIYVAHVGGLRAGDAVRRAVGRRRLRDLVPRRAAGRRDPDRARGGLRRRRDGWRASWCAWCAGHRRRA